MEYTTGDNFLEKFFDCFSLFVYKNVPCFKSYIY